MQLREEHVSNYSLLLALIVGGYLFGCIETIGQVGENLPLLSINLTFCGTVGILTGTLLCLLKTISGGRAFLAAFILTTLSLFLLRPLYRGHSMSLVYTQSQTLIVVVVGALLILLSAFFFFKLEQLPLGKIKRICLTIFALSVLSLLIGVSNVFLVRLWGFATMEYLQVALLGLTVAIAALPFLQLFQPNKMVLTLCSVATFFAWWTSWSIFLPDPKVRAELKHRFPNATLALNTLRTYWDQDADGYSGLFGFGDCDDNDQKINPKAIDWPGNKIDENCFAGDLQDIRVPYFNIPISPTVPKKDSARRQIVILLTLDTLREDAVDYTLNGRTPNIASIAARSTRFSNAYAQSNNTLESFPFVLHLGFRNLPAYNPEWTLAKQLRNGGVKSIAVLQASVQKWWSNDLDRVFFDFDSVIRGELGSRSRPAIETSRLALAELAKEGERDTFLFLHFESLHDYFTQNMEGNRIVGKGVNLSELVLLYRIEEMVRLMKERYNNVLSELDRAVGVLWQGIQELEKEADLTLILFSDHGEEFYEHGGLFHMGTLHQELLRVPMLIYQTGLEPKTRSELSTLYQIPATVLDLFGYSGEFLEKVSLLSPNKIEAEAFSYFSLNERDTRRSFGLIKEHHKLVYDQEQESVALYDHLTDQEELINQAYTESYQPIRNNLMKYLDRILFYMNYGDQELLKMRSVSPSSQSVKN